MNPESVSLPMWLLDATDVMLVYLDRDFNFLAVNAAYAETCRMPPQDMIGRNHFDLYPSAEIEAIFRRVRDTGESVFYKDKPFEFPDQPERGVTYWDWSLAPVRSTAGQVTGLVFSLRETTEYKQVELALRESEERFRAIASNTPDHILVQDRELRYSYVLNPQLGLTEQDMIGKTDHDFLSKEDADALARIKREVLETGRAAHLEVPLISRKGEPEYFEGSYVPKYSADGQVDGLIGYFRDVTERKRMEEELRVERDRAKHYLDIAGVMMVAIDPAQRIILVNRKTCEVLGRVENDLIGRNWFDNFVPEEHRDRIKAGFNALIAGEVEPWEYVENPLWTARGEERLIAWHNTVMRDEKGGIIATLSSGEDITERKRAEESLRLANERLELAQQAAKAGSWDWDMTTGRIEWTWKLFEIFGIDPKETAASFDAWRAIIHPEDLQAASERIDRAVKDHTALDSEYRIVLPDGQVRWINALGHTLYDESGRPVRMMGICLDITKRRQAEMKYSRILAMALSGFWSADGTGRLIEVNDTVCRMLGYSREELLTMTIADVEAVESPADVLRRIAAIKEQGSAHFESRQHRKDGVVIDVEVNVTWLDVADGQLVAFVQDISERKKAEKQLRGQLDELQRWHRVTLGREGRIQELKSEVNQLLERLGEPARYLSPESPDPAAIAGRGEQEPGGGSRDGETRHS